MYFFLKYFQYTQDEFKSQDIITMKNKDFILYLDMDGVLVHYVPRMGNYNNPSEKEITQFWANLDWIRGGKEVFSAAVHLFDNVCILSSSGTPDPIGGKWIENGKRQWLEKHVPSMNQSKVFIVGGKHLKKNYATKNSILVDDMPVTIDNWNDAGGFGILHSCNRYKDTITTLEEISGPISIAEMVKRFLL